MSLTTNRLYTIAAVSKLTGVSCHALRAWERRYHFPVPHRTESGHRRYDGDQVRLLRRASACVQQGRLIGEVIQELLNGRLGNQAGEPVGLSLARGDLLTDLVNCLGRADLSAAEVVYAQLARDRSPEDLATTVIEPAFIDTGERWFRGEFSVAEEHCCTQYLTRKLELLLDAAQGEDAHPRGTVLLASLAGERHGGGLLILALLLELRGWRAIMLGTDIPFQALHDAVDRWRPNAVAVSFVLSRSIKKRFWELSQLEGVPVFVGGRSILNYQRLARRHGLIPLSGPANAVLPLLLRGIESGKGTRSPVM